MGVACELPGPSDLEQFQLSNHVELLFTADYVIRDKIHVTKHKQERLLAEMEKGFEDTAGVIRHGLDMMKKFVIESAFY